MDMLIADDHALYRQLLRPLLASRYPDADIGEAEDFLTVRAACIRHRPRLLILDMFMPGMDGLSGGHEIIRRFPDTKVLICSAVENPILIRTMLAFGARGYVSKAMPAADLLTGIQAVKNGGTYQPPGMFADDARMRLTGRQWEVLGMVCMGLTNQEIAYRLDLSISMVRFHVGMIIKALRVRNRQQAFSACTPI